MTKMIFILMFVVAVECLIIIEVSTDIMNRVSIRVAGYLRGNRFRAGMAGLHLHRHSHHRRSGRCGGHERFRNVPYSAVQDDWQLAICIAVMTIIMTVFGVNLVKSLIRSGTLRIIFGAQEIISQFFNGIVLLSARPFRNGDFINLRRHIHSPQDQDHVH